MAAVMLPWRKVLQLVQRTITRTIVLQESTGKGQFGEVCLESVMLDNEMATAAYYLGPFAWNIIFHNFIMSYWNIQRLVS
ncbi:hypothetical protein STEG23_026128 [Scotinomys teguina]